MEKKFSKLNLKSIDEQNFTIDFIMTTEVVDRHEDVVDVDSIKLENYLLNPVVIPSHDYSAMAVGKCINIWKDVVNGNKSLCATVKFAVEEYELAKTYWNLYKNGYMNAVSIGFRPERGEMVGETFYLFGSEILELSLVSIPANQLALAMAKGIDVKSILNASYYLKSIEQELINTKNLIEKHVGTETVETTTDKVETTTETVETVAIETAEQKKLKRKNYVLSNLNKAIRVLNDTNYR